MILEDARQHYYTFSGSLSNVNRQLCFAGIAVIWIFASKNVEGSYTLPSSLMFPLGFFVLGLALDLLHYIVASATWGTFHRLREKSGIGENTDFGAPWYINFTPNILFWFKVFSTLIGYGALLKIFIS